MVGQQTHDEIRKRQRFALRTIAKEACEREFRNRGIPSWHPMWEKEVEELSNEECGAVLAAWTSVNECKNGRLSNIVWVLPGKPAVPESLDPTYPFCSESELKELSRLADDCYEAGRHLRAEHELHDADSRAFQDAVLRAMERTRTQILEFELGREDPPVDAEARAVWKFIVESIDALVTKKALQRGREYLAQFCKDRGTTLWPVNNARRQPTEEEISAWAEKVAPYLPEGISRGRFRYLAKHRSITFEQFKTAETPEGIRLTKSKNHDSIASMLRKLSGKISAVTDDKCSISIDMAGTEIKMTIPDAL